MLSFILRPQKEGHVYGQKWIRVVGENTDISVRRSDEVGFEIEEDHAVVQGSTG